MVWAGVGLGGLALIGLMFANFGALAMRLQETTEAGDWGRRAIWRDTWRMTQDFWLAGVGAGAFERGMLLYQQGSRMFFFNHAHDEYLQILAEGGLLLAVPAAIAAIAGALAHRQPASRRSHADLLDPRRRHRRHRRGRGAERLRHRPAHAGQWRALRDRGRDRLPRNPGEPPLNNVVGQP